MIDMFAWSDECVKIPTMHDAVGGAGATCFAEINGGEVGCVLLPIADTCVSIDVWPADFRREVLRRGLHAE